MILDNRSGQPHQTPPASCRDRGRMRGWAGALCLSSSQQDSVRCREAEGSHPHKAPASTPPLPLSLQNRRCTIGPCYTSPEEFMLPERRRCIQMHEVAKILRVDHNLTWLPEPNESLIALSSQLPPLELISTALVLAFAGDRLLMTELVSRGWDIPGGHIEPGEHPEATVRRETLEETGTTLGELHQLGHQRLRLLGPAPAAYAYPYPDCYQVFYQARVISLADFLPTPEARGRAFFPPAEARTFAWMRFMRVLYETALHMVMQEL